MLGGEDGKLKRARVLPRCRRSSLRRPGCILLSSATRTGARIYAADVPGEHRTAQPGGTVGSRFIAEPAPIYRGSTRSARCRHGPCAHSREAQEGCRSSPPSYSEAGCCPTCRAHATDRGGTKHEAIVYRSDDPSARLRFAIRTVCDHQPTLTANRARAKSPLKECRIGKCGRDLSNVIAPLKCQAFRKTGVAIRIPPAPQKHVGHSVHCIHDFPLRHVARGNSYVLHLQRACDIFRSCFRV